MVPAPVGFAHGGPPHLAHADHQGLVEQSTVFHVEQQRRQGLVETGQQVLVDIVVVNVAVPAVTVGTIPQQGHKPGSRLKHPPGDHCGLPKQVPAIAVAEGRRLLPDVERVAERLRSGQREGPLAGLVEPGQPQ